MPTTFFNLYLQHLKVLGNKREKAIKLSFLRYPTGGSGMISELFFWRPIEKFLCSRYAISFWRSLKGGWPHAKIQEISRKIPGNFRKFPGKFPEISRKIPRHPGVWIIYVGGVPNPGVLVIWGGVSEIPPGISQSIFSKWYFDSILTFISHTLHVCAVTSQ